MQFSDQEYFYDGTVDDTESNDMLALRHALHEEMKKPGPNIRISSVKVPFSKDNFERYFWSKLLVLGEEWNPESKLKIHHEVSVEDMVKVFGRRWHILDGKSTPEVTRIVDSVELKYEEKRDTLVTAEFCPR